MSIAAEQENVRQIVLHYRIMDDDLMKVFFKGHPQCVERLLRPIMEKPDLTVQDIKVEDVLNNLHGHGVRFDIHAVDGQNKHYDIELQRSDDGADFRRARYNSSLLDASILSVGEDYSKLPETYVIFITENDVIGKGWSVYRIERCIMGSVDLFDDGEHIVYVNGKYAGDDEIGQLMHDIQSNEAEEIKDLVLATRMRELKSNETEVALMCKAVEEYAEKYAAKKAEEYAVKKVEQEKVNVIRNMMKALNITAEKAIEAAGIPQKDYKRYLTLL